MVSHFLFIVLTLGVATLSQPAGGLVLREQRSDLTKERTTWKNPTEAHLDLSGTWQWRTAKDEVWHSGWIPSCYDDVQGEVIFQREFSIPDSLRHWHFHLVIPQVNYKVRIIINGKFIESVAGNHLGFVLDVPSQLLRIRLPNTIELHIDNRLSPKTTLPLSAQLYAPRNFGGIPSGCYLWVTPPWAVEGVVLQWPVGNSSIGAVVLADISRALPPSLPSVSFTEITCCAEIQDEAGEILAKSHPRTIPTEGSQMQQVMLEFPPFQPRRWTPETPSLYFLDVRLETSEGVLHLYRRKVGFKQIAVSGDRLLLNEKPFLLRGVQYVPEDPGAGAATTEAFYEADIRRMKELGFNTLHVIPSPPSPLLLDVCDRMGMLVLAQLPLSGVPADLLSKPSYSMQCEYALKRLVRRDRMHVCIAAWGLGCELDWEDPRTLQVIGGLAEQLRHLDERPMFLETCRLAEMEPYPADFFLQGLAPWRGNHAETAEVLSRPVVLSRVGMMVTDEGKGSGRGSASNQADFLLAHLDRLSEESRYAGLLLFCFSDFRGQVPFLAQDNREDPFLYSYGLVDLQRRERVSFFKLRDLAQTGETTPISQSPSGESPRVEFPVVSLALIVLLSIEIRRNNVFKQNIKRVFLHAHGFFSDICARRFLQSSQTVVLIFTEALCWALLGSSLLWGLRHSYRFDYLATHFLPWPAIKLNLWDLVWNPIFGIVGLASLCLLLFLLAAVMIKIGSFLFRARVTLGKAITYLAWAGANFLFLLPFAVIFHRLVGLPDLAAPCALVLVGFLGWFGLRLFNALRVAYNTSYPRLYLVVISGGSLAVLVLLLALQASLGTVSYMIFYWNVLAH